MVTRAATAVKIRCLRRLGNDVVESASTRRLRLLAAKRSGKVSFGGAMAARQQVVCSQCDKSEEYCVCEKYCTICKGQSNARLCVDGLYYCPECREACDVALANDR
jgi:hypothetical protein